MDGGGAVVLECKIRNRSGPGTRLVLVVPNPASVASFTYCIEPVRVMYAFVDTGDLEAVLLRRKKAILQQYFLQARFPQLCVLLP